MVKELSSESLMKRLDREFFLNGHYIKNFDQIKELGKGCHGIVLKALDKNENNFCAIKKTEIKKGNKSEILIKLHKFSILGVFNNKYIVESHKAWLESTTDDLIALYIKMELCDKTLKQFIDEFEKDPEIKRNGTISPVGFYIASQLFIELVECVQFLHEKHLIHENLRTNNILLKLNKKNGRSIKIPNPGYKKLYEFAEPSQCLCRKHIKYTAPEVRSKKYDLKADIYSLGVIFMDLFDFDISK